MKKRWRNPNIELPSTKDYLPGRERYLKAVRVKVEVMLENGKVETVEFRRRDGDKGGAFVGFEGTVDRGIEFADFDWGEMVWEWHVFDDSSYQDTHKPERAVKKWRYLNG